MSTNANNTRQEARSPLHHDDRGAPPTATQIRQGRPPRRWLRKLGVTGVLVTALLSTLALAPSDADAATIQYATQLSPTGTQPLRYVAPSTAPQGVAQFTVTTETSSIYTYLQFTNVGPGVWNSDTSSPCPGYLYPDSGRELYVIVGGKIASRALPPETCDTISDTWYAGPQIVQAIEANPNNAIVYVQAPPGQPGSREYLPGGVVLNPGSIWAHLQIAPGDGLNL